MITDLGIDTACIYQCFLSFNILLHFHITHIEFYHILELNRFE